jgi:hypothetical protein
MEQENRDVYKTNISVTALKKWTLAAVMQVQFVPFKNQTLVYTGPEFLL